MDQQLKERLIGTAVLIALAVIFIPMVLDGTSYDDAIIQESNIPQRPAMPLDSKALTIPRAVGEPAAILPPSKMETDDQGSDDRIMVFERLVSPNTDQASDTGQTERAPDVTMQESSPKETDISEQLTAWIVQLGSFSDSENAELLNRKLKNAGYASFIESLEKNGVTSYRVRIGPEIKRENADSLLKKLQDTLQIDGIIVSYPEDADH